MRHGIQAPDRQVLNNAGLHLLQASMVSIKLGLHTRKRATLPRTSKLPSDTSLLPSVLRTRASVGDTAWPEVVFQGKSHIHSRYVSIIPCGYRCRGT